MFVKSYWSFLFKEEDALLLLTNVINYNAISEKTIYDHVIIWGIVNSIVSSKKLFLKNVIFFKIHETKAIIFSRRPWKSLKKIFIVLQLVFPVFETLHIFVTKRIFFLNKKHICNFKIYSDILKDSLESTYKTNDEKKTFLLSAGKIQIKFLVDNFV